MTDLKGGHEGYMPHPWGPKFFHFHAVFEKIWQNRTLATSRPGELATPPRGNPGSAIEWYIIWDKIKYPVAWFLVLEVAISNTSHRVMFTK